MTKIEILNFLKYRTFSNIIDMFIIFFGAIFILNIDILLGILYLVLYSVIFYFAGYTPGGYIFGIKAIFKKRDILTFLIRVLHTFIYNNFLLNIAGEFSVNSCGQYYYDKIYKTYFIYRNSYLDNCSSEYKISKFWHFKYYFFFIVIIFAGLLLMQMI